MAFDQKTKDKAVTERKNDLEKWKYFMISLLGFIMLNMMYSPVVSFAADDLDAEHHEFFRTYDKNKPGKLNVAQHNDDLTSINDRQILVKIDPDIPFEAASFGVRHIGGYEYLKENHIYVVRVPESESYHQKLVELNRATGVLHAESDYLVEQTETIQPPTDASFQAQWYLDQINLLNAWEITQGSKDVTVAVIDTGVEAAHPDLKNRVLAGYDFVDYTAGNKDALGHGTHVAGIIAANADGTGIVGIDQAASILPIRAMGSKGTGSISGEIDGIYYAIEEGADIINMSYVIEEKNMLEKEALWEAHDAGIVLVAAAGNYAVEEPMYPGSYPQVINVSSTTKQDQLAAFSNYGPSIDLAAPGEDIYGITLNNGYISKNGTSFSAPIVSGVASLVKAKHPKWNPNEIRYALESGANRLQGLEWDHLFGFGQVNAHQALLQELPEQKDDAGNDSESAKEVESGKRMHARLDLPLDTDWYTFTVPETTEVTIDVINESSQIDLNGVLYQKENENVEEVHVVDDTSMGGNEQLTEELEAGDYYFAVSDYHGRWSEQPYYVQIDYVEEESVQRPYPDVTMYNQEINYLREANIIQGFLDGEFKPNKDVLRLQALNMILHEKGINPHEYQAPNPHFQDMSPGDEGYEEVAAGVDLGIIKGSQHGFQPWKSLTRAQMAAMMTRAYGFTGISNMAFSDVGKAHWAYESIQALVASNIVQGYPNHTFKPYDPLSRQHFALMMYRKMTRTE